MALTNDSARRPRHMIIQQIILTALVVLILAFVVLNTVRFFARIDLTESRA